MKRRKFLKKIAKALPVFVAAPIVVNELLKEEVSEITLGEFPTLDYVQHNSCSSEIEVINGWNYGDCERKLIRNGGWKDDYKLRYLGREY